MKTNSELTLAFRNEVQMALFDIELCGQISDGHWENANPREHWVVWCDASTVVDPTNVGRSFYAARDYYGFSSPVLLNAVEGRMLAYARMTLALGIERAKLFSQVACIDDTTGQARIHIYDGVGIGDFAASDAHYWRTKQDKCEAALKESNLTIEQLNAICTDDKIFSHKDLVRELRDMSRICRTVRATQQ